MSKKLGILLAVIFIAWGIPCKADTGVIINNGLTWLSSNQNPDGSWGVSDFAIINTAEPINSLRALGSNGTDYTEAVNWLSSQQDEITIDELSRKIISLTNGGVDVSASVSKLISYWNSDSGWGISRNYSVSNAFDTTLALQALRAVNYQDQNVINSALAHLISTQNFDGGWAFRQAQGDETFDSNVYMTALVLNTLSQFKSTYDLNIPINNAAVYLLANQNADGGFGTNGEGVVNPAPTTTSTVYETALTFESLIASGAVGADKAANIQNALTYLTSTQLANGSWDDDPYSTALALWALALDINPPAQPTTGTITGTISDTLTNQPLSGVTMILQSNTNINAATDATGSFTLKEIPVGSQKILLSLTGYGTSTVAVNIIGGTVVTLGNIFMSTNPTSGTIKSTITDAANGQPMAGAAITVAGSHTAIAVSGADGSFTFTSVLPGTVTITASMAGYYPVGATGTIAAGSTLFFNPKLSTSPPPVTALNLSITSVDITFSNPTPKVGDTTTITAIIHNAGFTSANNVFIQIFDGDPANGGLSIAETTISSISANGGIALSLDWPVISSGAHKIFVLIDSLNAIEEQTKSDNMASANLTAATLPDLSITSGDITYSPPVPMPGDAVTITAIVRNKGESWAKNVTLDIYDRNPASGGIRIGNTTFPAIGPGGSATFQLTASFAVGSHNIYAVADINNILVEDLETNNAAMKTLQVGYGFIDLTITDIGIAFSPASAVEGNIITIDATVHNEGEAETGNVLVRFYLGDPDSGGIQLGSDVTLPIISARGIASASTIWNSTGYPGNNKIYVQVDPLDSIFETSEFNNKASKTVKVAAKTGPDLTVTSADINFTLQTPIAGDTVIITANIKNIGTADANNVPVEFSLGAPNIGGTLIIGIQTIPFIAKGSSALSQITWNTTGFTGSYEFHVNSDPFNEIPELIETNNTAHLPIPITTLQGSDLTISAIGTSNLITDTQTMQVTGSIAVTIENKGNQNTGASFEIVAFEDRNKNKTLDTGVDNTLGTFTNTNSLAAGGTDTVIIPVSGNVLFRDNLIYVMVDSGNALQEMDETNNMRTTGQQCEYKPPVGTFNPVLKWAWNKSLIQPTSLNVMMTPSVIDINQDGAPDVIFGSTANTGGASVVPGVLRALNGKDGSEIFSVTGSGLGINAACAIAVGDIDLDGLPEIVACDDSGSRLIAFEHDGTFKWRSGNLEALYYGAPSLADLDGDGKPEIIIGRQVLNSNGTLLWTGTGSKGGTAPLSLVADINLDGIPEIVAGDTVYKNNGQILWKANIGDGLTAVGNFDDDPFPEIVLVNGGRVWLLNHDGTIKWGPVAIPGGGHGGAPTIADFDGDGKPEIGVAGAFRYAVFETDGSLKWATVISDYSSNVTGSSVFDFEGDGAFEVVYRDQNYLRVYKGINGQVIFQTPMSSCTWYEYVLVADVDADNNAEIVAVANNNCGFGPQRGVYVYGDVNDNWVNTRKIWNQHTYHITNINDDGTIPRYEQNNWEIYNNYRSNSLLPEDVLGTADITVSYITIEQTNYPTSVRVSARIGNGGAVSQIAGIDIAFYDGDPNQGGVLLGRTKTTRVLGAGDYEDVSVTWNNPSSGNRTVFVIADNTSKFNECRENNNIASASLSIGISQPSIQYRADLEISPADITIIPPVIEGQTAKITAIVHNTGNLGASDVVVSFYDGDVSYGGTLIGSVTKSYIDAGATALAEVSWNTMGQSGRNYVHVVVDPQGLIAESNENNNAALLPVDVTPPTKPDLAITGSDITFSNLNPQEGQPLVVSATVHNFGTAAAGIKVHLYDGNPSPGGVLLSSYTIAQIIPFGGQTQVTFTLDTVGLSGSHEFHIVLDPEYAIDEINETNNTAWNSLTIGPSGLSLGVSADKASYHSNDSVLITVTTGNLTELSRSGYLEVRITDLNSNVVSAVALNQAITLGPNGTITTNYTWNTGQTFSGDYRVYAVFMENGSIRAKADSGISILKDMTLSSKVTTDRISYYPNQQAAITSSMTSLSANYIFENLTATIAIRGQQSASILHAETTTIPILMPGQLTELKTYWNTGTNPPGAYPITLEIRDASDSLISTATATLTISSEIKPSRLLRGQISVDRQSLLQGEPLNISYQVTNVGNVDLSQVSLSIRTVHVVNLSVYDTLTDQAALQKAASYANAQQFNTGNYSAKDYLVILAASINGIEESLAGTYFRVEGAPSAPSLNTPAHNSDVETLSPILSVNNATDPNDDRLTYEFQVFADEGLTTLVAESTFLPEGASITSWQVTATLQENAWYFWRARAFDSRLYGEWMDPAAFRVNVTNEPPTAPTLSAPAESSFVDTLLPVLTVNNATDPDSTNLTYNFVVALDPAFVNIVDQQIGLFAGQGSTSWQVTIPLEENSWYYWKAQADDWLIIGPWMTTARFFVNTSNEAPSAPVIIAPIDNSEIASRDVVITISNSTDPDSAAITYLFEVDSALTFDTPDRVTSGSVLQGSNTISWLAAGLKDNTYYYARVKATDGKTESPQSAVVGFFVNTANDVPTVPVLSNPSNGSGVNSFSPVLTVHNATDIDGDILAYDFELYADAALSILAASVSGIQETPQITGWIVPVTLTENSTYFWRARAYDGQLYGQWMAAASFMVNTANDAPTAPSLNAPAHGSSLSTLTPTLSIHNATDPDSDNLTYDFEIYAGGVLVKSVSRISQNVSGVTSYVLLTPLSDNTTYTWRARAYDNDRYGAWMDMATFSIHMPSQNITSTIDFDPNTLNQKSKGNWVTVYIELPVGYNVANIHITSLRLNGAILAETWPYAIGDYDHDGIPDLMVKFDRNAVINLLPNGEKVKVTVTGTVGATTFEGVDYIRVIH